MRVVQNDKAGWQLIKSDTMEPRILIGMAQFAGVRSRQWVIALRRLSSLMFVVLRFDRQGTVRPASRTIKLREISNLIQTKSRGPSTVPRNASVLSSSFSFL